MYTSQGMHSAFSHFSGKLGSTKKKLGVEFNVTWSTEEPDARPAFSLAPSYVYGLGGFVV